MPPFFSFDQGNESAPRHSYANDASPLLGRFRAVPRTEQNSNYARRIGGGGGGGGVGGQLAGLIPWRGSVHIGYGALLAQQLEDADDEDDEDGEEFDGDESWFVRWSSRIWRRMEDLWVTPKQAAVRKVADVWWSRWFVLVVLPAALAVGWCALPFPQYPLPDDSQGHVFSEPGSRRKAPGHGEARVQVNFWFFLFVYYGFYNLTALIWITKVFNLYSLNWWPSSLGFPVTVTAIAIMSIAIPVPIYFIPETRFLTVHNTAWISWTFIIMAMPVAIAFCILMNNERHLSLRHSLSETQRIFTSSWWTGEPDTLTRRDARRPRPAVNWDDMDAALQVTEQSAPSLPVRMRRRWLPASFVRFIWFCLALFIGLMAYVIGEAYAEIYLRTLPHKNFDTVVYVYGWILTVHLLDGLTGWILGGNEGERVGSYPLSWIFKLCVPLKMGIIVVLGYFMLTYQTYVRALYARLRSPSQFVLLQVLSSTSLIVITPILMSAPFHWLLTVLKFNGQSYGAYQKVAIRNVFIRFLAENASMLAFLGSVVVLHFGANRDVYPYFSFNDASEVGGGGSNPDEYTFQLTFYASSITWACELVASFVVAGLIRWIFGVNVVTEGKLDLAVWPELLPTSVAVMLHVLQNMLFSIIRLQFR